MVYYLGYGFFIFSLVFFALALDELAKVALCLSLLQAQLDVLVRDQEGKLAAAHPLL